MDGRLSFVSLICVSRTDITKVKKYCSMRAIVFGVFTCNI